MKPKKSNIESEFPIRSKQYYKRFADGFAIRVLPSGVRTWLFIYTIAGKRRQMNLGEYPDISEKIAKDRLIDARKAFKDGIDPQEIGIQWHRNPERDKREAERLRKEDAKNPTIEQLALLYMEKHAKPNKREACWKEDQRLLNKDIIPIWGKRKAKDITKRDIKDLLQSVVTRGPALAANIKKLVSKMFSFAVEDEEILDTNPCFKVKLPEPVLKRNNALKGEEIRALLVTELPKASMSDEVKRILTLILVTAQRPGEVAGMHRKEIDDRWWTIPADRAKNGRPHRVYLTDTALELIGDQGGYIFPSPKSQGLKPIGVNALAYAIRRNLKDYVPRRAIKGDSISMVKVKESRKMNLPHFTPHDLRRSATSLMAAARVSTEHRERVLNHSQGKLDGIYNVHDYEDEKREALIALEDRIRLLKRDFIARDMSIAEPPRNRD